MNATPYDWQARATFLADPVLLALRSDPGLPQFEALVATVEERLLRLKAELHRLRALQYAVRRYHASRPGHMHDRLEQEVVQDVEAYVARSHQGWSEADFEEIGRYVTEYLQTHPLPGPAGG